MTQHRTVTLPVTAADVGALTARIFDETRTVPIVLVSPASDTGEPRVPVEMLAHRFTGVIAVLQTMDDSAAFSDAVGDRFRAFGGAIRVIYPGAVRDGEQPCDHTVFITRRRDDPRVTADAVVHHIETHGPTRPDPHASSRTPVDVPLPGPATATSTEDPNEDRPPEADAVSTGGEAGMDLPAQVAAMTAAAVKDLVADLVESRDDALAREATQARQSALDAEQEVRRLNEENHCLRERLATESAERKALLVRARAAEKKNAGQQESSVWPPTVHPDDPEAQFRYEIEQRWLCTYTPEDRREYPLREYTLSPGFLGSLTTQIVPTRKAIDVCVEVITQRVFRSAKCHPVFESGRGSPAITRTGTCDVAYRANIKSDSPGAPRLMWWQKADGCVELIAAAHHDDLTAVRAQLATGINGSP